MAYENKTVDYVYGLLIQSFQDKFNNKFRLLPKSFVVVLSKIFAGVFVILYKLGGWFYLQLWPDTASFEAVTVLGNTIRPLVQLGKQFGVGEPESGCEWRGTITVTAVSTGKALTLGTQLKSDKTGLVYNVAENTGIEASAVQVPVYCVQAGESGNLSAGDVLNFVSPLGFVETNATVSGTTQAGTDDETEEHYRNRVKPGYGPQPQGGSLSDYRIWAQGVSGVMQVYPYNDTDNPAGVLLYVAGDPSVYTDRIPDSGLCKAVGEACTYDPDTGKASRKPLTAVLDPDFDESYANVRPVRVTTFGVSITGVTGAVLADFSASVKSELAAYFESREPFIRGLDDENARADDVLRNAVIAVVSGVASSFHARFDTAFLLFNNTSPREAYTLGQGELCELGELRVNEVVI